MQQVWPVSLAQLDVQAVLQLEYVQLAPTLQPQLLEDSVL